MLISLIGSILLKYMSLAQAALCSGIGFMMITLLLAKYMKTKLGLPPDAYLKKDIKYPCEKIEWNDLVKTVGNQ